MQIATLHMAYEKKKFDIENKKIKKVDNIPEGWYKGRIIKK
jgi:hypothetical protein